MKNKTSDDAERQMEIDYHNPALIRRLGIEALTQALGPVGMAYFIRQFDGGSGDYTAERRELLRDVTLDEILDATMTRESNNEIW
jgi:hypothetical protein